jgi:hypothetical protein
MAEDDYGLGDILTPTLGPCVPDSGRPAIWVPPICPPGVATGTLVPALVKGYCPDQPAGFIRPGIDRIIEFEPNTFGSDFLIGVVEVNLAESPVHYAALFGFEKIRWLGFDEAGHLIGAGGGSVCPWFEIKPRLASANWLVGPRWGD